MVSFFQFSQWSTRSLISDNATTAQEGTFSVPAPDPFDAIFSLETSSGDPDNFASQFDLHSSFTVGEDCTNSDFENLFSVDISAWDEAVFGVPLSQESTPSSSSSIWEPASKEDLAMETGTAVGTDEMFQFPSVDVDGAVNGTSMPTDEEFLRAIIEAAQSTPKKVSWGCARIRSPPDYPLPRWFCPFVFGTRLPCKTALISSLKRAILNFELEIQGYGLACSVPFVPLADWFGV